jgi:glycosyltransferase involved in cell wall biosynthesis
LRDIVEDGETGFVVPVGDVAALAGRLGELLADRDLRERFGAAGRSKVEQGLSIERTAARMEALVRSVVGS